MAISRPRILVADDETGILELLVEVLRDEGFDVIPAHDGAEALNLVRNCNSIDIVITDINMPGADGYKVAASARRSFPRVGVVFISGRAENQIRMIELENSVFLHKPFSMRALLAVVEGEVSALQRSSSDRRTSCPRAAVTTIAKVQAAA